MSALSKTLAGLLVALALGLFLGRCTFAPAPQPAPLTATAIDRPAAVWTCSMHPQIQQAGPGQCPICGMDLIPLETDAPDNAAAPRTLAMSPSALALAEIQTLRVERRFPEVTVRLVGQLDYDETRLSSLTARFPARIDQLFVNYTGVPVAKGEHLARIYSPELVAAQRELLTATAADPSSSISRIAREKLRLWDLLPEQIDAIVARGSPADDFELRAPTGGVVVAKNVKEGDYVKTGEPLFRIADLGELWLHLQAFESDLAKLRYGQSVAFTVEAWPGETFTGRIAFIAPAVDPRTRTIPVRVNVPNVDRRLKPGMFARGQVRVKLAAENQVFAPDLVGKWIGPMHPEIVKDGPGACDVCGMPLVPAETLGYAANPAGEAPVVVPGTDQAAFEGRDVTLGAEAENSVVILSGLAAGEEIVTHGAFKIDSALQILAQPSMMNPASPEAASGKRTAAAPPSIPPELLSKILPGYFQLQTALARDDFAAAQASLRVMMAASGPTGVLADLIHRTLGAENVDTLREPRFADLSNAVIAAVQAHPAALAGSGAVLRVHCPMAAQNRGADWLPTDAEVRNPYFGAAMLTCGEIVEQLH